MTELRNFKTTFDINRLTRLNDDCCEIEDRERNNNSIINYNNFDENKCLNNNNNNNYLNSLNIRGVYQGNSRDGSGQFINEDSKLKNGKDGNIMTNNKSKSSKILDTSSFLFSPFLGAGQSTLKNPDIKSELLYGENTANRKSGTKDAAISINRFTPLVPCLKENVQNTKHIIPEYWIRGGLSTRSVIRNIDYMRTCGIRR